jgi:hypothetical protein
MTGPAGPAAPGRKRFPDCGVEPKVEGMRSKGKGYVHRVPRLMRGWRRANVRPEERWLSLLAGLGLAALGLRQWRSRGLAMLGAGFLLRRGLTGLCPVYRRLGLSSR